MAAQKGATILDLTGGPASQIPAGPSLAYQISRTQGLLSIVPQQMAITSVVNTAGYGPGLSPGGLFTIFGGGLANGSEAPEVTVSGQSVPVLAAFPFQVNVQMPESVAQGAATLLVKGSLGTASKSLTIAESAPGIFAIVNPDGGLNSPSSPAQRGQYISIYGTGLGATAAQGNLRTAIAPVTVWINSISVAPSFAGLTPGLPGLYQVNVQIPMDVAPGVSSLWVQQAGQNSNTVLLAFQ
jgi:uncharacterized protein (TIGR03437 family)